VQEIREYEGDIEHVQGTMWRRSGNMKERRYGNVQETRAGDQGI
jgi:hypothetical protein